MLVFRAVSVISERSFLKFSPKPTLEFDILAPAWGQGIQ
jgi:hypothetical protein